MRVQAAVLPSCTHINSQTTPAALQRIAVAAELVCSAANRPDLSVGEQAVPHCLHPHCRYPSSSLYVCIHCVHIACHSACAPVAPSSRGCTMSHLAMHHHATSHPLYISVDHRRLFCFPCADFVHSRFLDPALELESRIASASAHAFRTSLSPLDPPPPRDPGPPPPPLARCRRKKRRLLSRDGWAASDAELLRIAAHTRPVHRSASGLTPPVGLFNLGNSCYMNSVLQALLNAPPLRHFFLADQHKPNCSRPLKLECFACAMDQLVCDSYMGEAQNGKHTSSASAATLDIPFLVPNVVLDIMWRNAEHLATYTQHDAHEFLIAALNLLNSHCRVENLPKVKKEHKLEPLASKRTPRLNKDKPTLLGNKSPISPVSNMRVDAGGAFAATDGLASSSTSIVQNLFSGTLQSDVVCRVCNNSSPTLEKFYDISLDVDKLTKPASTKRSRAQSPVVDGVHVDESGAGILSTSKALLASTGGLENAVLRAVADGAIVPGEDERDVHMTNTLHECLGRFTDPELLGASCKMHCVKCGIRQEAVKQMSIRTLPPILCLHFKRFEQSFASVRRSEMVKIDTAVEFPVNGLDLSAFLTSEVLKKRWKKGGSDTTTIEAMVAAAMGRRLGSGESGTEGGNESMVGKDESMYDLFAIVNHIGKIDSGHYTAMVRNQGKWFRCDDEKVSPIESVKNVIRSEEAYLLFYVQRSPKMVF